MKNSKFKIQKVRRALWLCLILHSSLFILHSPAATVKFDLADFTTVNVSNRNVIIAPLSAPYNNGGQIMVRDTRRYTATNGVFYVSNMLARQYFIDLQPPPRATPIYIEVTNSSTVLNAGDLLIAAPADTASGYTKQQVDAMISTNGGSGTSGAVTNYEQREIFWGNNQNLTNGYLRVGNGAAIYSFDGSAVFGAANSGGLTILDGGGIVSEANALFLGSGSNYLGGTTRIENLVGGSGSVQTNIPVAAVTNAGTMAYSNAAAFLPLVTNAAQTVYATNGTVNPWQFGATGDGSTDDTGALQAWINYSQTNGVSAILPPASGGAYKITRALTNVSGYSVYIRGTGLGGKHYTSNTRSASTIRQFTRGAHGLNFTNAADNIHIENIIVEADPSTLAGNQSNSCWGIGISASGASDNFKVSEVGVFGFGKGFYGQDLADGGFDYISAGNNGVGLFLAITNATGGVLNNIRVSNFQLSYNTNQAEIYSGTVTFDNGDIAPINDWNRGLIIYGGIVTLRNMRFEDYSSNTLCSVLSGAELYCYNVGFNSDNSPAHYSIGVTNASGVRLQACSFQAAVNGYGVYESAAGNASVLYSAPPMRTVFNGSTTNTSTLWFSAHYDYSTLPKSQYPDGTLSTDARVSGTDTTAVYARGSMENYGDASSRNIDLLQYYKDTIFGLSNRYTGSFTGNGSGLTNLGTGALTASAKADILTNVAATASFGSLVTTGAVTVGSGLRVGAATANPGSGAIYGVELQATSLIQLYKSTVNKFLAGNVSGIELSSDYPILFSGTAAAAAAKVAGIIPTATGISITNTLTVGTTITATNGFILPSLTNSPPAATVGGAQLWSDGTNLCVIIRNVSGTMTTNKVTMTAWP